MDEWLEQLYAASIPCGPINDVAQAMEEEHTKARGLRVTTEHPRFGTVEQLASPVRVGSEPPEYRRAPRRNEDFDLVVREIAGYDDATVERLRAGGAFGDAPAEESAPAASADTEPEAASR